MEDEIPSAEEMAQLAFRMREETIGKAARDIVRDALKKVAEPDVILKGTYEFVIAETEDVPAAVLKEVLKELRERGYKPKRRPEPGVGTWIQISWPIAVTKKRKPKERPKAAASPEQGPQEINFKKKSTGAQTPDRETILKQKQAAKHRKKALQERSDLPK